MSRTIDIVHAVNTSTEFHAETPHNPYSTSATTSTDNIRNTDNRICLYILSPQNQIIYRVVKEIPTKINNTAEMIENASILQYMAHTNNNNCYVYDCIETLIEDIQNMHITIIICGPYRIIRKDKTDTWDDTMESLFTIHNIKYNDAPCIWITQKLHTTSELENIMDKLIDACEFDALDDPTAIFTGDQYGIERTCHMCYDINELILHIRAINNV